MDTLDKAAWYSGCLSITIIIWLTLASFLSTYLNFGQKENLDFIWQLIGFTFILATLIFAISPSHLSQSQRNTLSRIGFSFILSAIGMILGLGVGTYGIVVKHMVIQSIGSYMFVISMIGLSWGMAAMAMISVERMMTTFRKEK